MKCDMQNKYIPLQIDCDFSVRIQILQLQVLKTFATIIPSYNWCKQGEKGKQGDNIFISLRYVYNQKALTMPQQNKSTNHKWDKKERE